MDIEQLNKSQIILLTLLVSFVTSIATGIVTVSLMEQAPPALTQTVNRVVERTVEKVVPAGQAASAVTTEKTVVVKESDLIAEAVKKMAPSIVRVYSGTFDVNVATFLGLGVVLDGNGSVITDAAILEGINSIVLEFSSDGVRLPASIVSRNQVAGIVTLKVSGAVPDGRAVQYTPAVLSADAPILGQTVVVLSGKNIPRIADGLVTALVPQAEKKEALIDTNVSADFVMSGSPLVNTQGNLVGISTHISRMSSPGAFVSSTIFLKSSETGSGQGSGTGE